MKARLPKTIAFLYQHAINFIPTDKIQGGFPVSGKFLPNMIPLLKINSLFIILMYQIK